MSAIQDLERLLKDQPDTELIELLILDMGGCLRGKRIPPAEFADVFESGFNIPGGTVMFDSLGNTCDRVPYGTADGDPDVQARVIAGTLAPSPWAPRPSAQALFSLYDRDGSDYFADSRHLLRRVQQRLGARGLTPVMAMELEFYLLDAAGDQPAPRLPAIAGTNQGQKGEQTYNPDDLWQVDAFAAELNQVCQAQGVPVSTAISEFGPGQFEVNLHHVDDPLRAADHAMLLKRAVKAVALKHGLVACFMAKPFAESAGNGLHLHVSLVDESGRNFFSGGESRNAAPPFAPGLRHAVAGLIASMGDAMAVFAPNANSYRRLRPDFYAPVMSNWGTNHRQVSLRIPLSGPEATRIEHRTAGADANPYLVAAAVLMGIDAGLKAGAEPPAMVEEGEEVNLEVNLPIRWNEALDRFAASELIEDYFGQQFQQAYEGVRRTEEQRFHNEVTALDYQWYLRQV